MKTLFIRKIGIDVVNTENPFVEIKLDLHVFNEQNELIQTVPEYTRIYKRISELNPIPITTEADDGVIDNWELMRLVTIAAKTWVAKQFNGTIDEQGHIVIP